MAKAHVYLAPGANVEASDTFAGWIDTTNQLVYDMGTVVLTSVPMAQPNTTIGGYTSGNAHLQGIFSANTLVATQSLRGGTVSIPSNLIITSNVIFNTSELIRVDANTNNLIINANNTNITSNVAINNSAKTVTITAANTTINAGTFFVRSNTELTGTRVDVDGSVFSVTSNSVFTSPTLNANVDIITLGFNGSDTLNVNSVSDFNANVNIDGILSVTANAVFTGGQVSLTNNVIVGADTTDLLTINSLVASDILPQSTAIDVGSDARPFGNVHTTNVYADVDVESIGTITLKGTTAKTLRVTGSDNTYKNLNITFSNNTVSTTSVVANTTGLYGGANDIYSLGGASLRWKDINVKDAIANSAVIANLTVSGEAGIAKLNVGGATLITGNTSIQGNLIVDGTVTFTNSANVNLVVSESSISDLVVLQTLTMETATVSSEFVPTANTTYDLGTAANNWRTIFVRDVNSTSVTSANSVTGKTVNAVDGSKDSVVIIPGVNGTLGRKITIKPPTTAITADRSLTLADGDTILQAGTMAVTSANLSQFASTTSAQLSTIISDETGSGSLVFATSPSLTTPTIGNAGANFSGSTSGTATLKAPAVAGTAVITLPGTTGTLALTTDFGNGTLTITANSGLSGAGTFTANQSTANTITLSNTDRGSSQNIFKNITVGANTVAASTNSDTFTMVGSGGTTITANPTTKVITVNSAADESLASVTGRGSTTNTAIQFTNATNATSTTSGAVQIVGGLGVQGGLQVGLASKFYGDLTVVGDLVIEGTTTTINTTDLIVEDKNIIIGGVAAPSDTSADGGGITLKGLVDKTIVWNSINNNWNSSENLNVVTGKSYKINNVSVLDANTLGSSVTTSSLTTVGTIANGIWNATPIGTSKGGTGQTTYVNGEILIGNTNGNTLTKATLTQGQNITVTNGTGTISIAAANTNLTATVGTTAGPTINSSTGSGVAIPSASATASGVITTGAQTIAGIKTFNSLIDGDINGNANTVTNGVYTSGNQTIAGIKTFTSVIDGDINGNAATATTANKVFNSAVANTSATLVSASMGDNDQFRILVAGASDAGYVTFDVGDNGDERILFRQCTANFTAVTRTLTLLDVNGNTSLPGSMVAVGNVSAYSDERLKTNVRTIDNALDKVSAMRGVFFDKDDKASVGVIAQEIEKVLPEVVNSDYEYKSVAYGNIVGVLIEAIKELKAEIEELKKGK